MTESIPGSIFQTVAYLMGIGDQSSYALFSLSTSLMTIAFTSSMISFECDVSPKARRTSPAFYGYFPDGHVSRLRTFVLMFFFSLFHAAGKIFSISLLYQTIGSTQCALILMADQAAYLSYRFLRGDLHYWMNLEGALGWLVSFITRVVAKTIVDFTAYIHGRHPLELGGAYWSFSQLQSHVLVAIATDLFLEQEGKNEGEDAEEGAFLTPSLVIAIAGTCFGGWLLSFCGFLLSINREYVWTFFDRRSGPQFCSGKFFATSATDYEKACQVESHPSYYASFAADLREFIASNWERWGREKPEWFTAVWRNACPVSMKPASAGDGGGRRMSAVEVLIRLSTREEAQQDSDSDSDSDSNT